MKAAVEWTWNILTKEKNEDRITKIKYHFSYNFGSTQKLVIRQRRLVESPSSIHQRIHSECKLTSLKGGWIEMAEALKRYEIFVTKYNGLFVTKYNGLFELEPWSWYHESMR